MWEKKQESGFLAILVRKAVLSTTCLPSTKLGFSLRILHGLILLSVEMRLVNHNTVPCV